MDGRIQASSTGMGRLGDAERQQMSQAAQIRQTATGPLPSAWEICNCPTGGNPSLGNQGPQEQSRVSTNQQLPSGRLQHLFR